jgi:hypothetical protein
MSPLLREPATEPWLTAVGWLRRVLLLLKSTQLAHVRLQAGEDEIVYLGEGTNLLWLARLHGARMGERKTLDWRDLPALIGQRRSLIYMEINRLLRPLLPPGAFFTLPWLYYAADPSERGKRKMIEATYGRQLRQQGFTFRWVRGDEAARSFYRDFYHPYAQWRFGVQMHARGRGEIVAAARHGMVLHVLDKDRVVAAGVCRLRGDTMTFLAMGLAGDYVNLLRRGAMAALYYEVFRWAREHGMRRVNLLRSRPHLRDGVVVHKRRFGAQPKLDSWPHALLAVYPPVGHPLPEASKDLLVESGHGTLVTLAERLQF